MKTFKIYFISIIAFLTLHIIAQDIQYSQYYASNILMNPAFTGATRYARVALFQRMQWLSIQGKLVSSAVTYDRFFYYHKFGLGGNLQYDRFASGTISNFQVGPTASYLLISENNKYVRFGLGCNYVNKKYQTSSQIFGDQLDPNFGQIAATSVDRFGGGNNGSRSYADLNAGILYNTKLFWIGGAVHHLNKPVENKTYSVIKTPMKISLHTGYKIKFKDIKGLALEKEKSITLTANLKNQGLATQLDVGTYALLHQITFGAWYRGIPLLNSKNGYVNQDAAILMFGFENRGFRVAYSYDITLSAMGLKTGGSHELSMVWEFGDVSDKKKKKPGKMKTMYMPFPKL